MTCIAGVCAQGRVFIGGDSAGVGPDWGLTVRADEKVFRNGDFLFGFTTSFRMGQLLRHSFEPPVPREKQDPDGFMVTDFVDAVRTCLKSGGWASLTNSREAGGTFLVGYRGRLYVIYDDYQVGRPVATYASVGSGESYALGSLYTTGEHGTVEPERRIILALESAETHSAGVRGPFLVMSTGIEEAS